MASLLGVELARLGTWDLVTGRRTFTLPEFEDAIAASNDPEIGPPIIRPGHTDPRFDGEPALGRVVNMRMAGDRLVGDLVDLPGWLASRRGRAAYPNRSVEGYPNVKTPAGREYRLVLTGLALLGVTPPAVQGLADLPAAIAANGGQRLVAASAQMGLGPKETTMPRPVAGAGPAMPADDMMPDSDEDPGALAQAVDAILDEVQDALAAGDVPTAVALLTGAESTIDSLLELLGLPDADDVPNGPPMTSARAPRAAVTVSASRNKSRRGAAGMDHAAELRKVLGLAEDASDEDVQAAIAARPAPADDTPPTPTADTPPAPDAPAPTPTAEAPAGTVLVDAVQWAEVQRQAQEGAVAASQMRTQERERFIGEVVRAGRLNRANTELRASLEREWDRDPETARKVAAGLAKVVNTEPAGHEGARDLSDDDALYAGLFGTEGA